MVIPVYFVNKMCRKKVKELSGHLHLKPVWSLHLSRTNIWRGDMYYLCTVSGEDAGGAPGANFCIACQVSGTCSYDSIAIII